MSWFIDIINHSNLTIELVDNSQSITNSKDKKVRKTNKRAAKRKAQFNNLHALVQAPAAGFLALLLPRLSFVSRLGSSAALFSRLISFTCLSPFLAYPGISITLLSYLVPALVPESPAFLSYLLAFGQTPSYLASTGLRTFK